MLTCKHVLDAPAAPPWRAAWKLWSRLLAVKHRPSCTQDVVGPGSPGRAQHQHKVLGHGFCLHVAIAAFPTILKKVLKWYHYFLNSFILKILVWIWLGLNPDVAGSCIKVICKWRPLGLSLPLLSKSVNSVFTTLEISQLLLFSYLK